MTHSDYISHTDNSLAAQMITFKENAPGELAALGLFGHGCGHCATGAGCRQVPGGRGFQQHHAVRRHELDGVEEL